MNSTFLIENNIFGLFVLGIVVSVIIAYGVQFLLSLLSLATGVTMTPNLKRKSAEMKARHMAHSGSGPLHEEAAEEEDHTLSMSKMTSGIGLWVLVTASLALFTGSYFGVSMIPTTGYYAVIAGLVIWALFFISLLYLEYRAVHTIVGGLVQSALSGLRYSTEAIGSIFSPSKSAQMDKQVKNTVHTVYEEADKIIRKNDINRRLEDYVNNLKPSVPSHKQLVKDLEDFIDKLEVQEKINVSDDEVMRILDLQLNKNSKLSKEDAQSLKSTLKEAKSSADAESSKSRKLAAVIDSIAPVSDDEAKSYREKMAAVLNNTSKDELNASEFQKDIEKVFEDPKAGQEQLLARMKHFDRMTIKEIVSQIPQIEEDKAEKLVDMAYDNIQSLKGQAAEQQRGTYKSAEKLTQQAEEKIARFFDNAGQPELNYTALKRDVQTIFEDPASAPQVLGERMDKMDRSSVIALITSNSNISRAQAERAADKIIEAREKATDTLYKVQREARRRYEKMRRKSVIAAETARQNTVFASWWLFGSAAFSAIAAVMGAYLSVVS